MLLSFHWLILLIGSIPPPIHGTEMSEERNAWEPKWPKPKCPRTEVDVQIGPVPELIEDQSARGPKWTVLCHAQPLGDRIGVRDFEYNLIF